MRRSVNIVINVLTDDMDIDTRNDMVDDEIRNYPWQDDTKTAMGISYQVLECKKSGLAKLKATFEYN
jgi:hypothetical protein